ncbi:hypothetical protein H6G45_05040 [Synechocystis sp. FACHB-383]|uniref:hypothetical protein n=1 Tax=Synechocystis sp. FACHB-383 TaxID=2692864 RepID=UPI001681F62F|nr:hypothetical protein [Synechocystis sp. FACHB-383]MBD2652869.1 hypothetical protein [Synechocystis sp. FACHB-383]
MKKKLQILTKLLLFCFVAKPVMAQETHTDRLYKAYAFCENNGYMSTEAYIESKKYIVAICSNMLWFSPYNPETPCYVPDKHFIVVQSLVDNKISILPTWPQKSGSRFPYVYTFESVLGGIHYQIKTTGGSNSYS